MHGDNYLDFAPIDSNEVLDQVSLDIPDRIIFEVSPPNAAINSAYGFDALVRIVVIVAFVDTHDL